MKTKKLQLFLLLLVSQLSYSQLYKQNTQQLQSESLGDYGGVDWAAVLNIPRNGLSGAAGRSKTPG